MKAAAPGKIILSGEHAAVYGNPALALSVNRYVTTTITPENRPGILFDFEELNHRSHLTGAVLQLLKAKIKDKYERFKQGDFSIRRVLKKPFELAQFAFGLAVDGFNLSLPHGIKIHIESTIPLGCGMGSSAATIVSVMFAIAEYSHKPLREDELYRLALNAEKMQHGISSGVDLRVSLHGGCLYINEGEVVSRPIPNWPLYLINTGSPASSTGECVQSAAKHLKTTNLLKEFAAVTNAMDAALQTQSIENFKVAVTENHRLLCAIQVVPDKIQRFVNELALYNAAAKICGAGTIKGEAAGMLMIAVNNIAEIQPIITQFGYQVTQINAEPRGVHVI